MTETKIVGISDLHVSKKPIILKTSGLGSCVGIILYDKQTKIGGISHIMLPEKPDNKFQFELYKYCDTNIPHFYQLMLQEGANKQRIRAALFGGAEMFASRSNPLLNIGQRNVETSISLLSSLNIPILFQDTGGTKGRTIEIELETGIIKLRTSFEIETVYHF